MTDYSISCNYQPIAKTLSNILDIRVISHTV